MRYFVVEDRKSRLREILAAVAFDLYRLFTVAHSFDRIGG